jgi:type IV pilus assembly protein PilC
VPILQALDKRERDREQPVIGDAVDDVKTSVREGESIAKPLGRHKAFSPMVAQMMAVGRDGRRRYMLDKVAEFYDSEVTATVEAMTSLIEPLLIAVIGTAVGAAVIALYMPMFSAINLLK